MSPAMTGANEVAPYPCAASSFSVTMYSPATGRAFFFTLLFGPCPLVTFVAVSVAAAHSSRAAATTVKNLFIENLRIWWDCGFGGAGTCGVLGRAAAEKRERRGRPPRTQLD